MFCLKGKTVIITGGSTHLGKAMTESLCEYGADVVICSRNTERNQTLAKQLNSKYSVNCSGEYLDFSSEESINKLIESTTGKYNKIDILINNAVYYSPGSIEDQTYTDFMAGLDGTIGGTFSVTSKVLETMIKQQYGNIINIASMYGVVSPDPDIYEGTSISPNPANYGCGKAAVIQFTKYIACNYAKFNIRANCIVPGAFPNPEVQKDKAFINNLNKKIPMKRIGAPDDLKGVAVFLASDSSSYITGQNIHVDGGWTTW